jgi:hypothetical protein
MSDEAISDLTDRLAAMIERGAAGDVMDWTKMRLAVLELSQRASAGAHSRPVRCIAKPLWGMGQVVREGLETVPSILVPVISSDGVGMRLVSTLTRDANLLEVNLGVEGALELSGELTQGAVQSGTLANRLRQERAAG